MRQFREAMANCLILRMYPETEHGGGAAVAIVAGIDDQLIVQRDPRSKHRKTVVGLEDPFGAGIGQLSVADQNSKAASIKKCLVHFGNAVDDAGDTECVVIASPLCAATTVTRTGGDTGIFARRLRRAANCAAR
jgi:hypothetical protein